MKFVPIEHDACTSCHANSHRAEFRNEKCENCHPNATTWAVARFDHDLTRYDLEGEHATVKCEECHQRDKTAPIPSERCDNCHTDLHHGQFVIAAETGRPKPKPCDSCHTVQTPAFALRGYDHDTTDYPLVGKHKEQECEECHDDREAAVYVDLPHADCEECHEDPHQGRFQPTACAKCHISDGFEIQSFDHDTTDFPHTGKHVGLECNKCHRDYQWNGIPHESCNDCHYTRNPHQEGMAVEKCESCHVTEAFDVVKFDHVATTGFDLAPAHDDMKCASCHPQVKDFEGLDSTCSACHVDDRPWGHYEGDCGDCHEAELWFPAGLGTNDHLITGFALVGAHTLEPCESCHPVGQPRGEADPECAACHTRDDPHQNMLGTQCDDCHTEMSWLRTTWRHTATGWPLRGAHRLAACVDCHATGYVGTPTECFRCHETEAPLDEPAHLTAEFLNCDTCHRVFAWSPVPPTVLPALEACPDGQLPGIDGWCVGPERTVASGRVGHVGRGSDLDRHRNPRHPRTRRPRPTWTWWSVSGCAGPWPGTGWRPAPTSLGLVDARFTIDAGRRSPPAEWSQVRQAGIEVVTDQWTVDLGRPPVYRGGPRLVDGRPGAVRPEPDGPGRCLGRPRAEPVHDPARAPAGWRSDCVLCHVEGPALRGGGGGDVRRRARPRRTVDDRPGELRAPARPVGADRLRGRGPDRAAAGRRSGGGDREPDPGGPAGRVVRRVQLLPVHRPDRHRPRHPAVHRPASALGDVPVVPLDEVREPDAEPPGRRRISGSSRTPTRSPRGWG